MVVILLEWFVCSQLLSAQDNSQKLRIFIGASSNNFPPVNVLDKDGNLTGFGRDLSDAVIKAIGGKITHIHSAHWVEVLEWLDTGKADFIHDAGYTKDRDEYFDYSDPILEMPEVIFVRPDQYDITSVDSLKGKTVACVKKHITHLYLQTFPEINCYVVKTPIEGLYELVAGKVDAFVYPKQIVFYLAQSLRLRGKIKIAGSLMRTLTWSMVVKEGNMELLRLLNEGIAKVRQTGEYERIYDKWWGKKVLAGYSKRELQVITAVTTVISILIVLLISILFFNYRLRKGRKSLEIEVKERISVEEALREKGYIIESASSVIATADLEGNMTYANPAFLKTWGFDDTEEFLGRPFSEFWVVEDRLDEIMETLRGKGTWFGEIQARRKDGTLFDVQISSAMVFDRKDNPVALSSSSTDITERKQAEDALMKSETKYRELVQNANSIILRMDIQGNVTFFNEFAQRLDFPSERNLRMRPS
jgi:PAS domain S-box-containing protein